MITPNARSLDGPLIFMGMSILESGKISTVDLTKPVSALMKMILEGFSIVLYTFAMIMLSIVAFMRVFYLWIFIILSPLIILLFCLSAVGKKGGIKEIEGINKWMKEVGLNVESFIKLAFKPVLVTLAISMALIFSVLMKSTITIHQNQELNISGAKVKQIETQTENTTTNKEYQTSFDSSTVTVIINGLSKTFSELLLTIVTLIMMRFIIKVALTSGSGI